MASVSSIAFLFVFVHLIVKNNAAVEVRKLIRGPDNTAVVAGQNATLFCRSDVSNLIDWYFTHADSVGTTETISSGCILNPGFIGKYSVNYIGEPGTCDLNVLGATLDQAGTYRCKETHGFEPHETASLIIIESEPNCQMEISDNDIVEGDVLTMSCNVSYTSNASPILMDWTKTDGSLANSSSTLEPGFTESVLSVVAAPPTVDSYKCLTYFDVPQNPPTTATNAPTYTFTYFSPALKIAYCPTEITVTAPAEDDIFVGQKLVCSASGYPAVVYHWRHLETGVLIDGPTVTLNRVGVNSYVCIATVVINGEPCSAESERVVITVAVSSCLLLKENNPKVPSGRYTLTLKNHKAIKVYCEMGLNGGGYTFLSTQSLLDLNNNDVQEIYTDASSFLMRARKCDGTQPFGVLEQLDELSDDSLYLGLSSNEGYQNTTNGLDTNLQTPYLYFGFLSDNTSEYVNQWGLKVNGVNITSLKSVTHMRNYIALFPGFFATRFTNAFGQGTSIFCTNFFNSLLTMPSGRVMPPEFMMFVEMAWDAGCITNTNSQSMNTLCVTNVAIGFR